MRSILICALGVMTLAQQTAAAQAPAQTTQTGYRRLVAPERDTGWEIGVAARSYLGNAVGATGDAQVTFRARPIFFLRASADPLVIGSARGYDYDSQEERTRTITMHGAHFVAGVDHRLFEFGAGVGYTQLPDSDELALTIVQSVRLGARDGLHIHIENQVSVVDGIPEYSSTRAQLQIPLAEGYWLLARGGGGVASYGWGELALRLRAADGRHGQLFLEPSLGGIGMSRGDYTSGGFLVGLGLEWRPN